VAAKGGSGSWLIRRGRRGGGGSRSWLGGDMRREGEAEASMQRRLAGNVAFVVWRKVIVKAAW